MYFCPCQLSHAPSLQVGSWLCLARTMSKGLTPCSWTVLTASITLCRSSTRNGCPALPCPARCCRHAGLKHQHHTLAAAPAGYDDPASTYSASQPSAGYGGKGRLVGEQAPQAPQQQQQGGGGLLGAVKRAVGV